MPDASSAPSPEPTEGIALSEAGPSTEGPSTQDPPVQQPPESDAPPLPEGTEERSAGRTPYARRLEDPQRVEGRGRWSVDSTRRRCGRCAADFPDHEAFHTVLEPAPAPAMAEGASEEGPEDAPEVFVRRDYCASCFTESPPTTVFAQWRCVLPPPPEGARKVVNLASLLAHFHQLVETPAAREPGEDELEAAELDEADPGAVDRRPAVPGDEAPLVPHVPQLSTERLQLVYLLALFLVRRRMLKWEGVGEGFLQLRCKESDRPVGLPIPPWSEEELAEAIEEFEDLFR